MHAQSTGWTGSVSIYFMAVMLSLPLEMTSTVIAGGLPVGGNGDVDGDGLLTLVDLSPLPSCLTGPDAAGVPTGCEVFDFDDNAGIGLRDVREFILGFDQLAPLPVCGDGIINGSETCDDGGESAACDGDCTAVQCGDGVVNLTAGETCDDGGESATCDSDCTAAQCGDGILNLTAGEACDDGNTTGCDGCSATCAIEGAPANDNCAGALPISSEVTSFCTLDATTDGPQEPGVCDFFNNIQVESDVWFTYTSTCTGTVVFSLCGSDFDTKLAVYTGDTCPTASGATACNDDGCGIGTVGSRTTVPTTTGDSFLVRIGGFQGDRGAGMLTILCDVDVCSSESGACFEANGTRGCDDPACCEATCDVDKFCCDVAWDDFCSSEAAGICTGGFDVCAADSGDCGAANGSVGCGDADCCNTVCMIDPFCCITTWDDACVDEANGLCFLTCTPGSGSCSTSNGSPGCGDQSCCETVCAQDSTCCEVTWDQICADQAATLCP